MVAGLDKKACQKIGATLSQALSNSYLLLIKSQNFHWNVVDPRFHSLHEFFEEQYDNLFEAVDEIAERIRMLGQKSPGSLREFLDLSVLDEADVNLSGDEMLQNLLSDHEAVIVSLREMIREAQEFDDEGTADMFVGRLRFHEKAAWMLRSHLA